NNLTFMFYTSNVNNTALYLMYRTNGGVLIMNMAWKEIKKSKSRFIILGSIVFLVSLLTLIISGLANGLSQDNAALIKDMYEGATALSIQMGFMNDANDDQVSVAFATASNDNIFPDVKDGEVLLDESIQDQGVEIGDKLTSDQLSKDLTVAGFVEQEKFSHSPVAFISEINYQEMYRTEEMQMLFVPEKDAASISGLQAFSNKDFLDTIPSYSAEQLSLNMIVWFLVVIS